MESKVSAPYYSEIESEQTDLNIESDHDGNFAVNTKEGIEEILDAYDVIVPKNMLPPVSDRLAKTMTDWLRNVPNREKFKECFMATACLLPENVEGLKTVRINELLYQKLPFRAKVNDQRLCSMNSYFIRGTGPLIALLDKLIDFEATVKSQNLTNIQCEDTELKVQGSSLNLTEIRGYLHKSIQILSFGSATCLQKRKSLVKYYLDQRYHYLTKPSNPVTDELLGPNLEQKITESNKLMEAAQKNIFREKLITTTFPELDIRLTHSIKITGDKTGDPPDKSLDENIISHMRIKIGTPSSNKTTIMAGDKDTIIQTIASIVGADPPGGKHDLKKKEGTSALWR